MKMESMIVDLRPITDLPRHFELSLDAEWWEDPEIEGEIPALDGPLTARISIERAGSKFILRGYIEGRFLMICDRCLEHYCRELQSDFRLFLTRHAQTDAEGERELDSDDDLENHFVTGEELDLSETVREQVFLSLPMKSLCREDCLGLCAACGSNLNKGKCGCSDQLEAAGLSKLKNLKIVQGE
ncbi:MAG: DUF177 domain-containing protein [Desulfobacteraceae bacterium]|jgi:uncharacterized protein|nr:MAG: DUF177 domain-containing protein [Desulfobacteraceae bacterium]